MMKYMKKKTVEYMKKYEKLRFVLSLIRNKQKGCLKQHKCYFPYLDECKASFLQ